MKPYESILDKHTKAITPSSGSGKNGSGGAVGGGGYGGGYRGAWYYNPLLNNQILLFMLDIEFEKLISNFLLLL